MALELTSVPGVPGVYRQVAGRVPDLPRVRTDVAGFVGIAGPNRLGEAVRVRSERSRASSARATSPAAVG